MSDPGRADQKFIEFVPLKHISISVASPFRRHCLVIDLTFCFCSVAEKSRSPSRVAAQEKRQIRGPGHHQDLRYTYTNVHT